MWNLLKLSMAASIRGLLASVILQIDDNFQLWVQENDSFQINRRRGDLRRFKAIFSYDIFSSKMLSLGYYSTWYLVRLGHFLSVVNMYTILNYTILNYTILYYTILNYTILHYSFLFFFFTFYSTKLCLCHLKIKHVISIARGLPIKI